MKVKTSILLQTTAHPPQTLAIDSLGFWLSLLAAVAAPCNTPLTYTLVTLPFALSHLTSRGKLLMRICAEKILSAAAPPPRGESARSGRQMSTRSWGERPRRLMGTLVWVSFSKKREISGMVLVVWGWGKGTFYRIF